jgi:hypothetical protein
MRRLESLHAAAFLIDQNERVVTPDDRAHFPDKRADLIGIFDIAREQDEPKWLGRFKQCALLVVQTSSGAAKDAGACHATRVDAHANGVKRT